MSLNYEEARRLEGQMVKYKNAHGEWAIGKVVKVRKDGLEIEEFGGSDGQDGYGYGFWRPRPFWGPRAFIPFAAGFVIPFFLW